MDDLKPLRTDLGRIYRGLAECSELAKHEPRATPIILDLLKQLREACAEALERIDQAIHERAQRELYDR